MLGKIRQVTNTLFVKSILVLIMLSFVLWGVGDIFRSTAGSDIATVGDEAVTMQQFQQELSRQRSRASENGANKLTENDELFLRQLTLRQLIIDRLFEQEAKSLEILMDDRVALEQIFNDKRFFDDEGKFSKKRFNLVMNISGLIEELYISNLNKELARNYIIDALTANNATLDGLVSDIYKYEYEARTVDIITVPKNKIDKISFIPSEADLIGYHEKNKEFFMQAETRDISYLDVSCKAMHGRVEISQELLQTEYESNINNYKTPESRNLKQVFFKTKKDAKAAYKKIKAGEDFYAVAKISGLNKNQVSLGELTKEELIREFRDEVFALSEAQITKPIAGPFGWHIFMVDKVTPEKVLTFAQVKSDIEQTLRKEKSCEFALETFNQIEDELSSGATMKEAATKYQIAVQSNNSVAKEEGRFFGSLEKTYPTFSQEIIDSVFNIDEVTEPIATIVGDEIFMVVQIDNVLGERYKALDEVKGLVVTEWRNQKAEDELYNLAQSYVEEINNGKKANNLATKYGLQLERDVKLQRTESSLSQGLVVEIFALDIANATMPYANTNGGYDFAVLEGISPAKEDGHQAELRQMTNLLSSTFQEAILEQYNMHLYKKYEVRVNENINKVQ
jgi:peptidyl-prolyl cis-trans isomerase D